MQENTYDMKIIGYVHSGFSEKFGIPRQSGLVKGIKSTVTFLPEYANEDAFRGLEGYSHIWILWLFSKADGKYKSTVRPPRLGGNKRVGVFATRSPFRPNNIGLSAVKLDKIEKTSQGIVLHISGADILDGTPVLDIKPYLSYADRLNDASSGFADKVKDYNLNVSFKNGTQDILKPKEKEVITEILSQDPRPSYQNDSERIYGFCYEKYEIKFKVDNENLTVVDIIQNKNI